MKLKLIKLLCAAIVLSAVTAPASAFASSRDGSSGSNHHTESLFAAFTNSIASFFSSGKNDKDDRDQGRGNHSGSGHSSHNPSWNDDDDWKKGGFLDWLGGGKGWDYNWWDCKDSFEIWKRYYCY